MAEKPEPITNPVLIPCRKKIRDMDVDLSAGPPRRDNYGRAISATGGKK